MTSAHAHSLRASFNTQLVALATLAIISACNSEKPGVDLDPGLDTCLGTLTNCAGLCVDLTSDPAHCGACETSCGGDNVCSQSTCTTECDSTLTECGRSCVDTSTSPLHCGDCDRPCEAGQSCSAGTCVCPATRTMCGDACVDLDTHPVHCGDCDNACQGTPCVDGRCVADAAPDAGADSDTGTGPDSGTGAGADAASDGGISPRDDGPSVVDAGPLPPLSDFIVVDQFGYLPDADKVAVVRDPVNGYDADRSFAPGGTYAVIDAASRQEVFTGQPAPWNGGNADGVSGDRAWWFDFSSLTTPGDYFVVDVEQDVRSPVFSIDANVYRVVLEQATRTFFYQRVGFEKQAQYAGEGWADAASHVGPLQDKNARRYDAPHDASTERDLHGGWYDAGDYNKYTNWTADYVIELLAAYEQNPAAFSDATNIPESGNGIPDILDEIKWGMDSLVRMQNPDGSVLSVVGLASGSPPSSATGPSLYGPASTSATLTTAAAFAYGSTIFGNLDDAGLTTYADDLEGRAERAWDWAVASPNVIFRNNDASAGTAGLAAGQQEVDDYGRMFKRVQAACFLFEATGDTGYRAAFDAEYAQAHLIAWSHASPFEERDHDLLLRYADLPGATASVRSAIRSVYDAAMDAADNLPAFDAEVDPYRAHIAEYTWGSNQTKSRQGNLFMALVAHDVDAQSHDRARRAALGIVHYLHGVNPFGLVYLSNMYDYGAERSANAFFHAWFTAGSPDWDRVGVSTYGPAPGFLTGGPNPSYALDGCCPNNCAGLSCSSEPLSPPLDQPAQKSYRDFNASWPLNSWAVTENSNGYQAAYIKLLSKFVQ